MRSRPRSSGAGTPTLAAPAAPVTAVPWATVWASWLTARALVLVGAAVAGPLSRALGQSRSPHAHGLLGWDAAWYDGIALHGYGGMPTPAYRFFPLMPALARLLGAGHPGLALVLLSNAAAVLLAVLVHRLAVEVGLGHAVARRAVWATALAPAGFVLVMGYSEAVFGVLVAGYLLALLHGHRRWLLALGLLGGLARPTGVLLAVPAIVVAARLRRQDVPGAADAALGAAAPVLGVIGWLAWVGIRTGDPLLPLRLQTDPSLRGGTVVDPLPQLLDALRQLPHVTGVAVHLLSAAVVIGVVMAARRRLRPEHLSLVLVTLAVALTAHRLGSFERYLASAVPVALAVGVVTASVRWRTWLVVGSSTALIGYTALALGGSATP